MSTTWLSSYAERSLGNFEASTTLDRDLSRLALVARDDSVARERLFTLLAAKIQRFAARFRSWPLAPWTFEDVLQEVYPVYVETVRRWQPRIEAGVPAGYLFYFLRVYPHWLSDAVVKLTGRRRPPVLTLPEHYYDVEPSSVEAIVVADLLLDDLCEDLSDEEASILRLRVQTGRSLPQVACQVGVARRTAYRRWHNIVQLSRARWDEELSAS
jgi:DNA-directed RNA polymerase specialized sigma24 family protein